MTGGQTALSTGLMASSHGTEREIESRFGRISVHADRAIFFPTGILGMPESTHYCLARFPSEKYERFSILQSLEEDPLAFITLPLDIDNPIIERADFEQAAADLGLPLDDVLPLLIVNVHRETGVAKLTVNARAPILVRASMKVAAQYVFPHTKYLIRQPLAL